MGKLLLALALVAIAQSVRFSSIRENVLAYFAPQAINWPFSICGKGDWTIESLTMNSMPARNTNDDIVASGTAITSISFLRVDLEVKLNGVFLHSESIDFKSTFDEGDSVAFKYKNYVPSFAPAGTYTIIFNFVNTDTKTEGCMTFNFKL